MTKSYRSASVLALLTSCLTGAACGAGTQSVAEAPVATGANNATTIEATQVSGLVCPTEGVSRPSTSEGSLAAAFEGKFKVGLALDWGTLTEAKSEGRELASSQYNRVTSENSMKWQFIQPEEGKFDFTRADALVKFADEHKMELHGHTLMWHQQTPDWVFKGPDGKEASRELLLSRLEGHMKAMAEHFKGRVAYWDVVNEAFENDGAVRMSSPWRRIVGEDFLVQAFTLANRYFPEAKLGYNDYSMTDPGRRNAVVKMVAQLRAAGVRIDAVGMQAHYQLAFPSVAEIEETIDALAGAKVEILVTELDVDVLPRKGKGANLDEKGVGEDPYPECLPADVAKLADERWTSILSLYERRHEAISSVTFWGLSDTKSWRNDFPVNGRTNYALLFDRELRPKGAWREILKVGEKPSSH